MRYARLPPPENFRDTLIKYTAAELPQSIVWIFGLGFKFGIFLLMKSVLILFYLGRSLTFLGGLTIFSQALLGFILCSLGVNMQNRELYATPVKVRRAARCYLWGGLISLITNLLQWFWKLEYFTDPKRVNWFIDFFTGLWKGVKEIGLSILFVDRILWTAFSFLLFFVAIFYIHVNCGSEGSALAWFRQKFAPLMAAIRTGRHNPSA